MNWKWAAAAVVVAVTGSVAGSCVHANAATGKTAAVVYGTQGRNGYTDPRVKPAKIITEQGNEQWQRITWPSSWGKASVTSKKAQQRDCRSGACGSWFAATIKLYDLQTRKVPGPPGSGTTVTVRYYAKMKITKNQPAWWEFFGTDRTRDKVWHEPSCSDHGGPC